MACSRLTFLMRSILHFQFSTLLNVLSVLEPDQSIDSPDVVPIFEIRVLMSLTKGYFQTFLFPSSDLQIDQLQLQ